ncbi:hypothetical protein [Devosia sp. MC521]|uniref:hypothetical protein n=1 Tax=Devosia sp. MC521 TaxID=2759954 RepID=UPI0015FA0D07|nr:hypothetical protein [Devosia sp. MC521]MBJ6987282.1 hypothetical protein [Devosia sp. MC521]QMW62890.1 hypothetical protein H4N61_00515 [Devosia sp. MC521]
MIVAPRNVACTLIVVAVATVYSPNAFSLEYKTEEFLSGTSHVAVAYMCGVLGQKTGVEPMALSLVAKAMESTGQMNQTHSGHLLDDALTWWETEGQSVDTNEMWEKFCAQPVSNFKRLYGE